jgi:hypothetical protein
VAVSDEWREVKYREIFESELRGLKRRRDSDSNCTAADLEGTLRHLYNMDGSGWVGRGEVQDTIMAATIAAYEHFIARWKAEKTAKKSRFQN